MKPNQTTCKQRSNEQGNQGNVIITKLESWQLYLKKKKGRKEKRSAASISLRFISWMLTTGFWCGLHFMAGRFMAENKI